ncbi:DNA repair protein RAD5 [Xylariaceae sp. FL0255]|nr:DNA repair protein RAD5 [Xylariaceae sp. FL0255]
MSYAEMEGPPAKKRRFFADSDDDDDNEPPSLDNAPTPPLANPPPAAHVPAGFDRDTFQSLIGTTLAPEVLNIISTNCRGNLETAVNMYFDGTWKNYQKRPSHPLMMASRPSNPQSSFATVHKPVSPPRLKPTVSGSRYVGAFGVEGWATRSGFNLLKYGDVIKLERQKAQQTPSRMRLAAMGKTDVLLRFTDSKGSEIGRLTKDAANWITPLIDQDVCVFEGTCVYTPERLRTNDTVFIQLRCFLKTSVFDSAADSHPADNRSTGLYEEKESAEERNLRLRQVSIVKLFQEINLSPSRTSAKNARQGLLEAAEMAEKKNGFSRSNTRDTPGSSPPSDDAEEGEELEQDQLDALYRKAQSFDFNTPEAEPADTFAMELRPYQKQSLHWMLAKEKDLKNVTREESMHPLWEEYSWPVKDVDDKDLPQIEGQEHFYVNPYSGEMSLIFPCQEQHCLGGILADEMGLGKTIQMLSLVHSHKSDIVTALSDKSETNTLPRTLMRSFSSPYIVDAPKTTLVIAPMSLLAQWQSEAENASKEGTLKSLVYYGADKMENLQTLCGESNLRSAPDIIITSYGVVLSEFSQINPRAGGRESHSGLFSVNFFRIILDEAHSIKNRQSKTAKACYELSAEHRWVLTGTPIVNRLEDLFSLVRFLKVEPWNNFSFWRTFITVPFESKDFMRALDVVQTVLEPLVMRRTKDMKLPNGEPLVMLPPKTIEIIDVELSEEERAVYNYVFAKAKSTFSANIEKGTVMKAYTTIFAQILRLRQTCCHPSLVRNQTILAEEELAGAAADAAAGLADDMDLQSLIERFTATTGDEKDANTFGAHVLQQIRDEAASECPICSEEPMIDQTVTGCWHSACRKCLVDFMKHHTDRHETPRCFNCRKPLNSRDLFEVVRHDDEPTIYRENGPKISLQRLGVNESSSKVVLLMKHLRELRRQHPRMKSVVFSQFTSFMSLIEPALEKANMRFLRLDGTINQKTRAAILKEFAESDNFTVFLISLRAGGVGLNLTQAKRVYVMDPWWSFAVEAQAIDRVHRMGQDSEVKVYRFICKDSVEERMLKIQDRKKFIATSLGMMTDEEKRLQRIEDIKDLLS